MTDQELFDKVAKHLLTQGGPAMRGDGQGCAYRGMEGRKCAAGVLILDEHYSPALEGAIVSACSLQETARRLRDALVASGVSVAQFPLLRKLQVIHDAAYDGSWRDDEVLDAWRSGLTSLAQAQGLSSAVLG